MFGIEFFSLEEVDREVALNARQLMVEFLRARYGTGRGLMLERSSDGKLSGYLEVDARRLEAGSATLRGYTRELDELDLIMKFLAEITGKFPIRWQVIEAEYGSFDGQIADGVVDEAIQAFIDCERAAIAQGAGRWVPYSLHRAFRRRA